MNGRTPPRPLLTALLTTIVLTVTAACGAPRPASSPGPAVAATVRLPTAETTPSPAASPAPASSTAAETNDDRAVEKLAVDWLVAYRAATWTAPADAWIDRTAPYVTPELAGRNDQLRGGGRGPGIAWRDFVDRRCTAGVLGAAAVIPPEAPRTPGTVRVQAAGTLRTSCADGTNPPDEALAVTLTAVRTSTGWRIASRDY
jgi:hypothetical protein